MPLFSGACTKFQLTRLYSKFDSTQEYKATYGLPSVSKSSTKYSNYRYWQGPMWLNTNWLVIRGLELAGELDRAKQLTKQSVAATSTSGMYEYFDPDTGAGYGAKDFSWTAALILDLLAQARK